MSASEIFRSRSIRDNSEGSFGLDYFSGQQSNYPKDARYLDTTSEYRFRFDDLANWIGPILKRGVLLDVGGSIGHLCQTIFHYYREITVLSTDVAFDTLSFGKQNLWTNRYYPAFQSLGSTLPVANSSVDGIVFADVLEHMHPEDAESALNDSSRVLKNDGHMFISIPNRITWTKKNWFDPTHLWIPTMEDMKLALRQSGFRKIRMSTCGFPERQKIRKLIGRDLHLPFFGSSIFIHANKQ